MKRTRLALILLLALAGTTWALVTLFERPHPAVPAGEEDGGARTEARPAGPEARLEGPQRDRLASSPGQDPGGGMTSDAKPGARPAVEIPDVFRHPDEVSQLAKRLLPGERGPYLDALKRTIDGLEPCNWREWLRTRYVLAGFLEGHDEDAVKALVDQLAANASAILAITESDPLDSRDWYEYGMFKNVPFWTWAPARPQEDDGLPMRGDRATFIGLSRVAAKELGLWDRDGVWGYPETRKFFDTELGRVSESGPSGVRDMAVRLRRYVDIQWQLQMAERPVARPNGALARPGIQAAEKFLEDYPPGDAGAPLLSRALEQWLRTQPDSIRK